MSTATYQKWLREEKMRRRAGLPARVSPPKNDQPAPNEVPCCWRCGHNVLRHLVIYDDRIQCGNCIVEQKFEDRRGLMKILSGKQPAAPNYAPCPKCGGRSVAIVNTDPPEFQCGDDTESNCYHRWVNTPAPRQTEDTV